MPRKVPGAKIELVATLRYKQAQQGLQNLEKEINKMSHVSRRGARTVKFAMLGISYAIRGLYKQVRVFGLVLRSAIFRTLSYAMVNRIRAVFHSIRVGLDSLNEAMLNVERASVIMTRRVGDSGEVYENLKNLIFDVRNASFLSTKEIANMYLSMAKGGVTSTKSVRNLINVLSDARLITGESTDKMTLDMLKLANAFKIPGELWGEMAKLITVASTTSVGKIEDIVGAAKRLAPVFNLIYANTKKPLEPLKDYLAVVMATTAAGAKGTQIGTWMSSALMRLAAPTKKMIKFLSELGFNIYEVASGDYGLRMSLYDTAKVVEELQDKLVELNKKYLYLASTGQDTTEVSKQINEIQSKLNAAMKAGHTILIEYLKSGGKLIPLHEIFERFYELHKEGKVSLQALATFLSEAFSIRRVRGVSIGTAQVEKMLEIYKELADYSREFSKMLSEALEKPAAQVEEFSIKVGRLRDSILDLIKVTTEAPIKNAIVKYIIEPISSWMQESEEFKARVESFRNAVKSAFEPLIKDLGELITTYMKTIGKTPEERERALMPIQRRLQERLQPVIDLIKRTLLKAAKAIAVAFWTIFFETGIMVGRETFTGPLGKLFRFVTSPKRRIRELLATYPKPTGLPYKTFYEWVKAAYEGRELEKVPEEWRLRLRRAAMLMRFYGLEPVGYRGYEIRFAEKTSKTIEEIFKAHEILHKSAEDYLPLTRDSILKMARELREVARDLKELTEYELERIRSY